MFILLWVVNICDLLFVAFSEFCGLLFVALTQINVMFINHLQISREKLLHYESLTMFNDKH